MIPVRRRKQRAAVLPGLKDRVRLLERGHPCPFNVSRVDRDIVFRHRPAQLVIQTADHDRHIRVHAANVDARRRRTIQSTFNGLRRSKGLRHTERHGDVDADSLCGHLFNGSKPFRRTRKLDGHVRRNGRQVPRMVDHLGRVAIELRAHLKRKPPFPSPGLS